MAIKKGDIIKVEYEGTFEDGTVFDSTKKDDGIPLKFEVGSGQIIPGFDESVVGKAVGEEYEIHLKPSEAYGDYKDGLMHSISKDQFSPEQEPQVGMMVALRGNDGHPIPATIKEVTDDMVVLDLNHPLAGKSLNFKIKILETGCEPDTCHSCGAGCNHQH
ncbi:MAG: FKBP-type peptidyl-prolyl cis-trans isomerase [Promethearchaeota archaeon]|nr:MAG: FKBP-type peptidyl-prolyl cis-trans isomerase [Candidatus Lokiarchaeota archaeon]